MHFSQVLLDRPLVFALTLFVAIYIVQEIGFRQQIKSGSMIRSSAKTAPYVNHFRAG